MVPICDKRQNSNLQFTEFVTNFIQIIFGSRVIEAHSHTFNLPNYEPIRLKYHVPHQGTLKHKFNISIYKNSNHLGSKMISGSSVIESTDIEHKFKISIYKTYNHLG